MFRALRIVWKLVRAVPVIVFLMVATYTVAYFSLPQETETEEGQVIRQYESQSLDRLFEPAALVENGVRHWLYQGRVRGSY